MTTGISMIDQEKLLDSGMQAVEDAMLAVVDSSVDILRQASEHIVSAGGKRLRPRVVLLSYLASGGTDVEYVAPAAAALEMLHTASVVHDDINDHGQVRRGRASINSKWGRTFALLTGDFMFTNVYTLLAPYADINIDVADAARALVEGETMQAEAVRDKHFTREVYAQVIALKTAALFRVAAMIGAKLAGSSLDQVVALGEYGFNLGLAFQITDDILDIVGSEATLGKTAGIDVPQGRGFATAFSDEEGLSTDPDPASDIKRKLLAGDALEKARIQASLHIEQAIQALVLVPDSHARSELIDLATFVLARDH
jgi:octaprenyl-diphosphate synthase